MRSRPRIRLVLPATLAFCWLVYAVAYLARAGLSAGFGQIALHFHTNDTYLGAVGGAFFATYALGQLMNGYLGDRVRPERFVAFSTLGSVAVYALILLLDSAAALTALWAANGIFLSMLWGPMLRLLCMRFGQARKAKLAMFMGAAPVGGYCLAWLVLAPRMSLLGWQAVFAAPLLLTVALLACWFALLAASRRAGKGAGRQTGIAPSASNPAGSRAKGERIADPDTANSANADAARLTAAPSVSSACLDDPDWSRKRRTLKQTFRYVTARRLWPLALTSLCLGLVKENLALLLPTLFIGFLGTKVENGSWLLLLSPLANLMGLLTGWALARPLIARPVRSLACTFLGMAAMCGVLAWLPDNRATAFAALFLLTALAYLGSCIQISYLPLSHADENMISTLVGLFDFGNYMGAALASVTLGALMAAGRWQTVALIWLLVCVLASLCAFAQAGSSHARAASGTPTPSEGR